MKTEEILKILRNVGLNEYESKTYTTLVLTGQVRAGKLAKEANVPQAKIYEILEDLIEKQLVEVLEGRPKDYRAVPPEIALKNLIAEKEEEISRLKNKVKEVSNYLKPSNDEVSSGIWTLKGKKFIEFFNKSTEMIQRSKKYVYGVTRDYSRSAKVTHAVDSAMKKGVKIRVVGMDDVNMGNYLKVKWYLDRGIDLRTIKTTLHPRIVLVDGKEVLIRLDHDPGKKEGFSFSSIWSQDPSLVKVFDSYLKNLWLNSKPIDLEKTLRDLNEE